LSNVANNSHFIALKAFVNLTTQSFALSEFKSQIWQPTETLWQ
jgi:hypothetical protein